MAPIYEKRPGQWFAHFKNEHGRWRDQRLDARTKNEAKAALIDLEIGIGEKKKRLPDVKGQDLWTVNVLLDWCVETYWKDTPTEEDVRSFQKKHLREHELGSTLIFQVTAGQVERFLQSKAKSLSAHSLNNFRGYLHAAFNYARGADVFTAENPVTRVKKRKIAKRFPDYLRFHEVSAVLTALPKQWRAFFACALWTELRKGELAALRKSDVDLAVRELTVRRSWDRDQTKGGHHDMLPIAPPLLPILEAAINASPSELVFPRPDGTMHPEEIKLAAIFRRALRRAGMDKMTAAMPEAALKTLSSKQWFAANLLPEGPDGPKGGEGGGEKPSDSKAKNIGAAGFEPAAFWSQTRRSTKLSYAPAALWGQFGAIQNRCACKSPNVETSQAPWQVADPLVR